MGLWREHQTWDGGGMSDVPGALSLWDPRQETPVLSPPPSTGVLNCKVRMLHWMPFSTESAMSVSVCVSVCIYINFLF